MKWSLKPGSLAGINVDMHWTFLLVIFNLLAALAMEGGRGRNCSFLRTLSCCSSPFLFFSARPVRPRWLEYSKRCAAMMTRFCALSTEATVDDAVRELLAGSQWDFPVVTGGVLVGVLTRNDLVKATAEAGRQATVGSAMCQSDAVVEASEPLCAVFDTLRRSECCTLAVNLLDRLEQYDWNILAFLWDGRVPFTNDQAEQDIRMIKVRQKISGCFRTLARAQVFCRIRSYLSTCGKQGLNLWEALQMAVETRPFIPSAPPAGP